MSYATIKAGIITRLQTISGVNAVLGYEPTAPDPPVMCVILQSYLRHQNGNQTYMKYRYIARLYLLWQEFQVAELALDPFVNSVGASIDADPQLGGALELGLAVVTDAKAGWVPVGGVQYRILDTFIEAGEKGGFQSGI